MTKVVKIYIGVTIVSSASNVGKTEQITCKKIKLNYALKPYTKTQNEVKT